MNPLEPRQHRAVSEGETRRKSSARIAQAVSRSEATSVRHALRNLNPKEREYVKRRAKGEHPAEAYKQTHGEGRNSNKLEAKPQIKHALAAVETQVLRGSLMTIAQRRDYVLDRLKSECETGRDATRVRALELLGRTAGLWNDTREEPVGGADAIRQRIEDLLASVRGRTIEHAVDVGKELMPLAGGSTAEAGPGLNLTQDSGPEPHPSPTNPVERGT